jgi:hypothetical protein
MTYWLFQGNPKYYRIIDGIHGFEQMPWLATCYAKDMVVGDGVLRKEIWGSIRRICDGLTPRQECDGVEAGDRRDN